MKSLYICKISATVDGSPGAILSFTSGGVSASSAAKIDHALDWILDVKFLLTDR